MDSDSSDRVAMWQTYVQSAENTSTRREAINPYMVPIHLAILTGNFALVALPEPLHVVIGLAGVGASFLWLGLLDAHFKINDVKFSIIRSMEAELPYQPFDDEAKRSGIDTRRRMYPPLTKLQYRAAWVILFVHLITAVWYLCLWVS